MVVDLIGSGSPEPGVGPAAVEPGEVERQLVLKCGQAERDDGQTPGAFALDRSDPAPGSHTSPMLRSDAESRGVGVSSPKPAGRRSMAVALPESPRKGSARRAADRSA